MIELVYELLVTEPRDLHDQIQKNSTLIIGVSTDANPDKPQTHVYLDDAADEKLKSIVDSSVATMNKIDKPDVTTAEEAATVVVEPREEKA